MRRIGVTLTPDQLDVIAIGRKRVRKPATPKDRSDGSAAVAGTENWISVCRQIDEKIRRDGPWASAALPPLTEKRVRS